MATHSSVLAWRIPGTGEPGGLLSMGSHRVRHDWNDLAAAAAALIGSVMAFVHEGIFLSTRLILLWWEYKEQQITFELRRFLPFPTFFTSRTHSTPKCVAFSQSGGVLNFFVCHRPLLLQNVCAIWPVPPFSAHTLLPVCCNIDIDIEVSQLCPTLCDPMNYSLPGSSIHVTFQARVLEWVAISFSRRSSWPRDQTQVSHIVGRCFTIWATREVPPVLTVSSL